jgi:hypothetical protein
MLLLLACTTSPPQAPPEVPDDPPESLQPAEPAAPTQPDFRPPPGSPAGTLARIASLKSRCERDCARVLAAASSPGSPLESRSVVWWALSVAEVSDEVRAEIEAAADLPAAPPQLWPPIAASLRHTDAGRSTLSALMKDAPDARLRAAAACALLAEEPEASWSTHALDAETLDAMGGCPTPWKRGQVEAAGPPG